MPPKSRTAYCDLASYVEAKHPDLFTAFNGVCLRDVLQRGGITLIVPKDARALADAAWSDDAEVIRTTREKLLSHVLHGAHKDIGTSKDANTRQMQPRAIKLMKKGTDGVTILSGVGGKTQAVAKFAADFTDSSARGNNAVWIIESGEISADGSPVDIKRATSAAAAAKSGGYALESDRAASMRHRAAIDIEKSAARAGNGNASREVFCGAARGLALHIRAANEHLYYAYVLPRLAHTYMDVYVMLEPHKLQMTDEYLVPSEYIDSWVKAGMPHASLPAYLASLDAAKSSDCGAAIYDKPAAVIAAIAAIRADIVAKATFHEMLAAIEAVYGTLVAENQIGKIKPVFPEGSISASKLAEDDLRFWADVHLSQYYRDRDASGVNGTLNRIGDALHSASPVRITTSNALLSVIAPVDPLALLRGFVNSVFFLSFPLPGSLIASVSNYQSPTFGKYDDTFYNPLFGKDIDHERVSAKDFGKSGGRSAAAAADDGNSRFLGALKRAGVQLTPEQMRVLSEDM